MTARASRVSPSTVPSAMRLSDLEQTPQVRVVRTAIANWPLVGLGAFIGQARDEGRDDDELSTVGLLPDRAFDDAIKLLETWRGHRAEAKRLRALKVATESDGLLDLYTSSLLALGVAYGIRLAGEGR